MNVYVVSILDTINDSERVDSVWSDSGLASDRREELEGTMDDNFEVYINPFVLDNDYRSTMAFF